MTHADLVLAAARWLRRKGCGVVLTEHHGGTTEVPDAIGWRSWHSIQVECKVSRADFRADQKKFGRRFDGPDGDFRQAAERWYLTPAWLVTPEMVPGDWGLLWRNDRRWIVVQKPAVAVESDYVWRAVATRLYCELRRYQSQGLRYKTITQLQAEEKSRRVAHIEARRMGSPAPEEKET